MYEPPAPPPPVRVERAYKSDCSALAKIYCTSVVPTQPPDPHKILAQIERDWRENFQGLVECSAGRFPHDALLKAVRPAPDGSAEEVVGFALWWLKRRKGRGDDKDDLIGIQLVLVGVDPQHQRTGAGSALVRWGMDQADAAQVALHADSTQEGMSLYEHLGFTPDGEPKVDKQGATVYPMVYEPKQILIGA